MIDVRQLFGMRAVKTEAQVDLMVQLEQWDSTKFYDRLGIEDHFTEIMDLQIPCVTIPVRPGRNLASIVEVAAMNNRHRRFGYNAAEELARRVDTQADLGSKRAIELPETGRGRNERTMFVGIDVGGTNLKAGLVDEQGHLLASRKSPLGIFQGPEKFVSTLADLTIQVARDGGADPERWNTWVWESQVLWRMEILYIPAISQWKMCRSGVCLPIISMYRYCWKTTPTVPQ